MMSPSDAAVMAFLTPASVQLDRAVVTARAEVSRPKETRMSRQPKRYLATFISSRAVVPQELSRRA